MTARSWWVFLILMGPLVGVSFISAVRTYAEASGLGGSAAGVGEAFSPLIGVWAPTFSACEIAAAFLLPFVAIRVVAGDKQSGALKLEAQHPMSAVARIGAKAVVLLAGWLIALLAPFAGVVVVEGIWRQHLRAGIDNHRLRPRIERRTHHRAGGRGCFLGGPSFHRSDSDLGRHRRNLDSLVHRRGVWRILGASSQLYANRGRLAVPARTDSAGCRADRVWC